MNHSPRPVLPRPPVMPCLLDPDAWATTSFATARLGDARRARRLVSVAGALAAHPSASLPAAIGHPAGLKAAYRLLHESDVTVDAVTAPVRSQTLATAGAEPVVLLVQDTTEVDYTRHRATTDLGPIGNGGGQGYLLQSVLAITPETAHRPRRILGLAHLEPFLRVPRPKRTESTAERRKRARESEVWGRAASAIGAPPATSTWVHVGDRAADIFAFMQLCRAHGSEFLVRAKTERRVTTPEGTVSYLLTVARALTPHVTRRALALPARRQRLARRADLAIAWTPVTLKAPADLQSADEVTAWVVRVWEPQPPQDGTDPIEWILITSVPVTDAETAWERVAWYRHRWLVEEYHACLKTGCQLEASQLRDREALWRLLGLRAPLAVRLLMLREETRADPDQLATTVLPADLVALVADKTGHPADGMTLRTCWRMIARLGGHQGRTGDGEPGWVTIWRGWHYIEVLYEGVHWARTHS